MSPENQNPSPSNQSNPNPTPNPGSQTSSPAPAQAPLVVGPQHSSGQPLFAPDKPSQSLKPKRRLPKILLVLLLVLLLAGGVGGYAYWNALNNRPEKVLADALGNTMADLLDRKPTTTVGKFVFASNGDEPFKFTISFDTEQANDDFATKAALRLEVEQYNADVSVDGALVVIDSKTVYVKFDRLQKTLQDIVALDPESQAWADSLQPTFQKIDGQWIKIDSQDAVQAGLTESEHELDACSEAAQKLRISDEDKKAIKDIFARNQFAIASEKLPKQTIDGQDSFHYKLDLNERAGITFSKELVELRSFASVKEACGIDAKYFDEELGRLDDHSDHGADHHEEEETTEPVIELWVGAEKRLPTKLRVTWNDDELTAEFDTNVKIDARDVKIEEPDEFITLDEFLQELEFMTQAVNPTSLLLYGL